MTARRRGVTAHRPVAIDRRHLLSVRHLCTLTSVAIL